MGDRADFYLHRRHRRHWEGSLAWGGAPSQLPAAVVQAPTCAAFLDALDAHIAPQRGAWGFGEAWDRAAWVWPWPDCIVSNYEYVWEGDRVALYVWGYGPLPCPGT